MSNDKKPNITELLTNAEQYVLLDLLMHEIGNIAESGNHNMQEADELFNQYISHLTALRETSDVSIENYDTHVLNAWKKLAAHMINK